MRKKAKRIMEYAQVLNIKGEKEKANLKRKRQKPGGWGEETSLPGLFVVMGQGNQGGYYYC